MSPEIFQKVEIWALIFLSLKFRRRFSIVTYTPRMQQYYKLVLVNINIIFHTFMICILYCGNIASLLRTISRHTVCRAAQEN